MRFLLMLPSIALLTLGTGGCGDAGKHVGSEFFSSAAAAGTAAPVGGYLRGDGDADEGAIHRDEDDLVTRNYGHAASAADRRTITALVKRYYAAGAAGDGATACGLIYSGLANSSTLGEVAEADYPPAPGVPLLRGQSCVRIMSLLFREDRQPPAPDLATVEVTRVRVKGHQGLALLGFRATPERQISVRLEHGTWMIGELLGRPLG